ncbi:hypothetical protein [Streptomyces silvensis]|nr:hypothetical protein [Streptomyces silvensis]
MYKTGARPLGAALRALAAGAAAVVVLLAGSGESLGRDTAARGGDAAGRGGDAAAQGRGTAAQGRDTDARTHALRHSDIPWSGSHSPFESQVKLGDGRRVALYCLRDERLYAQDRGPRERGWSEPAVVYRAGSGACRGVTLRARAATVAAVARFGTRRVAFERDGDTLKWTMSGGFSRDQA